MVRALILLTAAVVQPARSICSTFGSNTCGDLGLSGALITCEAYRQASRQTCTRTVGVSRIDILLLEIKSCVLR